MEQSVMAPYFRVILEGLKQYPPSTRFTKSELSFVFADILCKYGILSESGKNSTALSAATGTSSWFFDSACCNHMTSDSAIFSSKSHASHAPAIQTADGSHIHATHMGHISTSTISLSDTYLIPKLTLNLISVGQLCELGLNVIFSATGCHVQDPQTAVSASPFFTDPSADIFLDDVDTGSSELPYTVYPEAPILSDDPTPAPSGSSLNEPNYEPLSSPSSPLIEPLAPPLSDDSPLRRSTRVREVPVHLRDYHCFSTILSQHEPHSYREASSNPLWQQAMAEELQALDKTHTWDIVDLPPGKTLIGSKWVYKIKTRSDGI
ncbi:hypothetical protein RHGRI_022032 [Rhododendron griersonianum]|uniref:Retrovirus-related Pol polyprotein from transposon TNT 1-94-like beta-barrel domain-containing protein n=1 Tax=Rhododendron griersonianum TaxID=479676 RepID=A0AAV6JMB9_9ERIC|nr:hypothetical protein RHGRI_022032 [Rhododendron griersonianum]